MSADDTFAAFLDQYCREKGGIGTSAPPAAGAPVYVAEVRERIVRTPAQFETPREFLTAGEVEGECLEWILEYLEKHACPQILAVQLARSVTDEVLKVLDIHAGSLHDFNSNSNKNDVQQIETLAPNDAPMISSETVVGHLLKEINATCARWKEQLPSNIVRPSAHPAQLFTSMHAIKNGRRKMEDKHVVQPYLDELFKEKGLGAYYAVFDGHGGFDAAKYASVHLHYQLAQCLRQKTVSVDQSLSRAFLNTDQMFIECAKHNNYSSGTTGVCVLVRPDKLHIAWLGDSQVLLVRDGRPVELMNPHKPEREDERQRIEALGGCVVWFGAWRVNGSLSVSRAIGDVSYKPYVSGEPDVTSLDRHASDDYLVIACDGLWDTLKPEDLVKEVDVHFENKEERSLVAQRLVRAAKERGSSDNITVIVVFLRDIISTAASRPASTALTTTIDDKETSRPSSNEYPRNGSVNEGVQLGNDSGMILSSHVKKDSINASNETNQLLHSPSPNVPPMYEISVEVLREGLSSYEMYSDVIEYMGVDEGEIEGGAEDLRRASQDSKQNVLDVSDDVTDDEWFGTVPVSRVTPYDSPASNPVRYASPALHLVDTGSASASNPANSHRSALNRIQSALSKSNSSSYASPNISNPIMGYANPTCSVIGYDNPACSAIGNDSSASNPLYYDSPLSNKIRYKSPSLTAIGYESSPSNAVDHDTSNPTSYHSVESADYVSSLEGDIEGSPQLQDTASDASVGEVALLYQVGRVARRVRRGHVTALKENRRPSGGANITPPCKPVLSAKSHGVPQPMSAAVTDNRLLGSFSARESRRSLTSQTSSQLIKILGGGAGSVRERSFSRGASGNWSTGKYPVNQGRWTIAVEVEEGAGMFHEQTDGTPSVGIASQISAANLSTHW